NEYLKKGMVDLELVVILCVFTVTGNIIGSSMATLIPAEITRTILTVILIYTAFSLLKNKSNNENMSFFRYPVQIYCYL
ncbi:TSUP family transporter, partial [Candidatus Zixiibacteriota bacterium]